MAKIVDNNSIKWSSFFRLSSSTTQAIAWKSGLRVYPFGASECTLEPDLVLLLLTSSCIKKDPRRQAAVVVALHKPFHFVTYMLSPRLK